MNRRKFLKSLIGISGALAFSDAVTEIDHADISIDYGIVGVQRINIQEPFNGHIENIVYDFNTGGKTRLRHTFQELTGMGGSEWITLPVTKDTQESCMIIPVNEKTLITINTKKYGYTQFYPKWNDKLGRFNDINLYPINDNGRTILSDLISA